MGGVIGCVITSYSIHYTKLYDVDYPHINEVVRQAKSIFDVRKIKVGNRYTLFSTPDSLGVVKHFVYEIDKTDFLVVSLGDSIVVRKGKKDVVTIAKTATAVIHSSMWNAMKENDINPLLAIELSEIYAWTVDFFGIGKGDYFKVIYDEYFVDDISIGVGNVRAAVFHHRRKDYYAFNYSYNFV